MHYAVNINNMLYKLDTKAMYHMKRIKTNLQNKVESTHPKPKYTHKIKKYPQLIANLIAHAY